MAEENEPITGKKHRVIHWNPDAGAAPNGAARDIAGIRSEAGNVVGLMPHPEHAIDPLTGPSADGLALFTSVLRVATAA